MLKSVEKNFFDFQCKLQEISSTSDSDSHHYEPYVCWQPSWIEVENNIDTLNICPACCKLVSGSFPLIGCQSPSGRYYLVHSNCTNDINQFIEYSYSAKIITSRISFTKAPLCRIGCSEYLVQLTFEHALTPKKFFSFFEKILESQKKLCYSFNQKTEYSLKPNCIVLPTKEFKCCLKLIPLFPTEQTKNQTLYFRIDLRKQKQGIQVIKFQENGIIFFCEFEIIQDQQHRQKVVEGMDFKYKRPFGQQSFVKFNNFLIELPGEYSQLNPEMNIEEKLAFSIQSFSQKQVEQSSPYSIVYQSPLEKPVFSFDFEFLRAIKTQNGSKQFQRKVKDMRNEEIQNVVNQILPNLQEIILNDYANYMFQSLLGACTFQQRMRILLKVSVMLARLVCQQQGTFVFQQLIAFLTTKEEFQCICQNSFQNFKIISMDNYGNHFMRKLIQKMPRQMIVLVIPQACESFSELSKNKNAVCVMKCILKVLYQNEGTSIEMAQQMKRILDMLTLHTQQLINDEFGNYLIQEAFDLVGQSRLSGISEFILNFFVDSSCSKFSNNVVMSCIKKHWRNNSSIFQTLKQKLDHKKIVSMYRQKEGNKILLEILQLPVELGVKDKINGALRNQEPSKYNSRHWVSLMNKSKTGAVGTNNYTSFSEAYSFQKRKNYN